MCCVQNNNLFRSRRRSLRNEHNTSERRENNKQDKSMSPNHGPDTSTKALQPHPPALGLCPCSSWVFALASLACHSRRESASSPPRGCPTFNTASPCLRWGTLYL